MRYVLKKLCFCSQIHLTIPESLAAETPSLLLLPLTPKHAAISERRSSGGSLLIFLVRPPRPPLLLLLVWRGADAIHFVGKEALALL
jgi:hypothetical protein